MSDQKQFVKEIFNRWDYFPTWTPITKRSLGDIGRIKDSKFEYTHTLEDEGISFQPDIAPAKGVFQYESQESVSYTIKSSGDAPIPGFGIAEAGVDIKFAKEKGIVFYLNECKEQKIRNIKSLKDEIISRYKDNK